MPYALSRMGIFFGVVLIFITAALSHFSSMMQLKVKDLTPRRYESLYEIAYLLVGRKSIFAICIVQFLSNYFACIMFYMIIGETISLLMVQLFVK